VTAAIRLWVHGVLGVLLSATLHAAPSQLTPDQVRHLLLRTGFAPSHEEVAARTGQDAKQVVAQIVASARRAVPIHPAPGFVALPAPVPFRLLASVEERQAQRREQMAQGLEMKRWWMREMIESATPLQERMTLFWHNHFATSQEKVVRAQAMWQQHGVLRAHALGSFRALLHGVSKDAAMLVYLDGLGNRKDAPNENFAREVMELFVLGESSQANTYTENDIREAARAFTGWSIDGDSLQFRFRPPLHDSGSKTVLGHTGHLGGDDVLDLLLRQPAAAQFVVAKLWREFVSPDPDPAELKRISGLFAQGNFEIALALQELLLTDAFWEPSNRGTLVKSPVELVVGTVRQFGASYTDTQPLVVVSAQLGQNLLVPPNVRGWPGYTTWIDASSLLGRKRFAASLFQGPAMADGGRQAPAPSARLDAAQWLSRTGATSDREPDEAQRASMVQAMLALPPTQPFVPGTVAMTYMRTLMQDAAYQLK
jgi:uncharacterized protein (DUF1800 family)